MPNENWVGFAKSPKPDPNQSPLTIAATVEFDAQPERVFGLVTSAEGLSSWLHAVEKTEVQTSGKIKFANVAEDLELGVFSLVEIGRKLVLNSELFGEVKIVFEKRKPEFSISFTKLVTESQRDSEHRMFEAKISSLKLAVSQLS